MHRLALEEQTQFAEVLDDEIGLDSAQLFEAVVTGEDRAGADAAVAGGFDVVLHVPDEHGFGGHEIIFGQDIMDPFSFVPDAEVGFVEKFAEAGFGLLHREMIRMNGAQKKGSKTTFAAEEKKLARVGEGDDGILDVTEAGMEPGFELFDADVWDVAVIKRFERQAEFGAELLEAQFRSAGFLEDMIAGFPDGWEVIDESARPVEDDVADHGVTLARD